MTLQLPLLLSWPEHATLDNFYTAEENLAPLAYLREMTQGNNRERCIYLHGTSGVGLSHLLYATCHAVQQQGQTAVYLPLKKLMSPAVLDGMENLSLICWDDVASIAGDRVWEEALFHCYNRAQMAGTRLLIASHIPPAQISWALPDLGSRLASSIVFAIQPLSDSQKIRTLQERAKKRGFDLSDKVGRYLLNHCSRDMHTLFATLEKLDHFSLAEQRYLTVPFVRKVLNRV